MKLSQRILTARTSLVLCVLLVGVGGAIPLKAQGPAVQGPVVSTPVTPGMSPAVRGLPIVQPTAPDTPAHEAPRRGGPPVPGSQGDQTRIRDPLLDYSRQSQGRTPDPIRTFDGMSFGAGGSAIPPDTIGDVGPNHYVQMVNSSFAIYDKSGTKLAGPTKINSLWTGQGNRCEQRNDGDPVVLYDQLADRWLLSQLVSAAPFAACIAISQTADPTGAYFVYDFPVTSLPDYLKFGVWPDAYYMATNESSSSDRYAVGVFAFDRASMLSGQPATAQKFLTHGNYMLPSDLDGATPPPPGSPNYFYTFLDDAFWPSQGFPGGDRLEVWQFQADFATPANSVFTRTVTLPIAAFNYTVCGYFNFNCIPQPGTTRTVDALSEWPMWRLQYRNFGALETLVGNFTVEVDGTHHAGIRWFELRKRGGGPWTLYQEGTSAPDSHHRWMGSIAMDQSGDIALGYSVSSSSLFPSIRYATRLVTETLGTFESEVTLQDGAGSQTGSNRWGDYSAMTVDPADGCTLWYTNEYYAVTSSSTWRTRIGAFKLPSCGVSQLVLRKTVSDSTPQPGQRINYAIAISNSTLMAASGAVVSDTLLAGLTLAGPVTLSPPGAGTAGAPPILTDDLDLAASQVVTITVPVTVNLGLAAGTMLANTAVISSTKAATPVSSTVSITVANAAPVLADDAATTPQDMPVTINVLANDRDLNGDSLTITAVSTPAHGAATTNGTTISYTPVPGYNGPDTFTYTVSDGYLSTTATVTVTVAQEMHFIYLPMI